MKQIFTLFLCFCCISVTFGQQEERIVPFQTQALELSSDTEIELKQVFSSVKTFKLDLAALHNYFKVSGSSGKFNLTLPNRHLTISWVEKTLLADDYQLIAFGANGNQQKYQPSVKCYEGYILDAPQYAVAITIAPDFINMMIEQADGNYYIERFSDKARGGFVYYRASDYIDKATHACGVDEKAVENQIISETAHADRGAGICYRVEVYIANDLLMFNRYGSAAAVEKHTLAVWNNVTTNYKKNFANDYEFKILKQIVATAGGSLPLSSTTDASALLGEFRDWAVKKNGFGDQKFDIAQMWTTRDISGGVVGVAYLGVVCGANRAQLIEDFSKSSENLRLVVAHETGHNFNMQHDPAGSPFIMAPAVNQTSTWSSQSKSQLNAFVSGLFSAGTSCLSTCGIPNQKPEVDFTSSTLAVCKGSKIKFTDNSTNDPTSWVWTFQGGTPAQSISESPEVVYTNPGVYDVTLKVTNAAGSNTLTKKQVIFVGESSGNYCKNPATQNTKAGIRFFKIANMANSSGNVQQDGNKYKDYSCTSIATLQPNTSYDCELTVGDCESNLYEIVQIYADYNNDADFDDIGEFIGFSSFAYCGSFTFKMTTPPSPVENKLLKLRVISSKGNNITLDPCLSPAEGQVEDYGILFQCPVSCATKDPVANFTSLTSTVCKGASIKFSDRSQFNPFKWEWSFPGGTPATSTEENPTVTYSTDGVYDVTLKVTNTKGVSSVEKKKYISVNTVVNNYCNTPTVLNTKAGIKSFKLANILNKSGSAQQDGNRYMDFSCTQVAILQANTTYDIELEVGDCSSNLREAYRIYIDYNNDGDFLDAGETIANNNTNLSCGLQVYNASSFTKNLRFTTPGNVTEGTVLRLRVMSQSSIVTGSDLNNPCYNPTDGQVEDYGVLFKAGAFSFSSNVQNVSCNGYDDGSIKLNPSGGKSPYNFDWNVNAYDGQAEAKNLKAGDYSVTVTDGDGFNITRKFTITQTDSIIYGVMKNHAQCSQPTGNIELAPVGGGNGAPFSYAWNHNPDEKTNRVENLYGGTYIVTITDGKGCKKEVIIPLDSTVMPDLSGLKDTIVCKGQSVTLTAKRGLKYKWSTGATTPSITVTTDGKYFVTATNGECETNTSVNVGFIDFTPEITGDKEVCQGNEAFLIASGAIEYKWSTGTAGPQISVFPQTTTTYRLTATYVGCEKTADWTISVTSSGVSINASKTEICAGESITLSSSDGKSYTWSNGQTGKSITVAPTTTTTYSFPILTIKCPAAYFVAQEIKVGSGLTTPSIQVLGSTSFCQGSSVTLVAPPDLNYKWSNGATTQTIDANSAGTYVVTVTKDGCSSTSNPTVVTVNPRPVPVISSPSGATAICDGANLQLNAPSGYDVYLWSNNTFGQNVTVNSPGTYIVTVVDTKGCVGASAPFTVNASAKPSVSATSDVTICAGTSTTLNLSASGGASPYTFNWGPNYALSSTTAPLTVATPTVTTTYIVTVTDSKGCNNTDNVVVTVLATPTINLGNDVSICAGSSIVLNATVSSGNPPFTYGWTPAIGLNVANIPNPSAAPTNTTTYVLSVTDSKGCKSNDNIIVSVIPLPAIPTITVNKNTLTSSATTGNQWFLNGQAIAGATNQILNITADGNYSVKVTSSQGNCSSISATVAVKVVANEDVLDIESFKVFPNPTEDYLVVQIKAAEAKILEVTDVAGREITRIEVLSAENFEQTLNTNSWSNGMFFIYVKNKDNEIIGVRQIVKVKH
jgi:PKD repeat protein